LKQILLATTLAGFALPALATSVFITNANFDDQVLGSNTYALGVQSWPGGTGGNNGAPVTSDQTTTFPVASEPPGGGPNFAILGDFNGGDGYIFQTLATAWAANTTYTLSFYVGHGVGLTYEGYLVTLDAGSTSAATAGTTLLASDNTGISGIGAGDWAQDTLTYTTGSVAPTGDITIELGLTPAGGGVGYDLITLNAVTNTTSTPEPGAWMMAAVGLSLLVAAKFRKASRA
jgi:hypothetical protein